MTDTYNLQRFLTAQATTYDQALTELQAGRKSSHWMWFIFPQLAGLGRSEMAQRYAISGRAEAKSYLDHSVLGPRLEGCSRALLQWKGRSVLEVMGSPDDMKLRSSMTLFAEVAPAGSVFEKVLEAFFAGEADAKTLGLLRE
ncbi:MAG TPA: DUF1810 domain-containing protein [Pseudomonas xinjiangensis]|uniref:DUF1810 domain-containing protein n=2 Tax=root TaxID=1 RepID=A0A7V1BLY2_9GAMM|nr:DUF1810 domain-containing protein [Halopseudomonas xinjiangensis]HEC47668.1 DUF1810 domain-containing protein [Halopseudomonas xinjiangensis]